MSERYPGMKALATRVFTETPRSRHGVLTREMKYYLDAAKAKGVATTMDWNAQNLYTLKQLFGAPPVYDTSANKPHTKPDTNNDRIPAKRIKTEAELAAPKAAAKSSLQLRQERFQGSAAAKASPYRDAQIIGTIVGTSTQLEKPFFRLTGQVNPAVVRPPEVIARALPFVLEKYRSGKGYSYITSQLQSIRQDLTVQHVESELTIAVYEINARIALFHDDLGEFNKCLTRLTDLYKSNPSKTQSKMNGQSERRKGQREKGQREKGQREKGQWGQNEEEFKAYSIYYTLLRQKWDEISLILQKMDTNRVFGEGTGELVERGTIESHTVFDAKLGPATGKERRAMLERALMSVHHVQQQDLFGLMADYRRAWPLEKVLLRQTVQRAQANGLEGVLLATKQQGQALPLSIIRVWLGCSQTELETLLRDWSVPFDTTIRSEQALPQVRSVSQRLGGLDIKGQI